MSMMTEYGGRPEDVGQILVKVQQDLLSLKEKLMTQKCDVGDTRGRGQFDISALENAIKTTEDGIKVRTEQVLDQINNRVMVLPNLDGDLKRPGGLGPLDTIWDLQHSAQNDFYGHPPSMPVSNILRQLRSLQQHLVPRTKLNVIQRDHTQPARGKQLGRVPFQHTPLLSKRQGQSDLLGPSPGEQFKQNQVTRATFNPYNPKHREVLKESFGLQLPLINERKTLKGTIPPMKGVTIDTLTVLPEANKHDPQLLPPPITQLDAQKGILSLVQRGLIPPTATITLEPSPVAHKMAPLHNAQDKEKDRNKTAPFSELTYHLQLVTSKPKPPAEMGAEGKDASPSPDFKSRPSSGRKHSADKRRTPITVKTYEMSIHQPFPPPTTPASVPESRDKSSRFAIQHGKVRENSQEFLSFKQHYCLSWGSIITMLRHLEKMLANYSVPIAFVNGEKLADLALEFELEKPPTVQDLLTVIVNREDVENIIRRPGRRFMGPNGLQVAATIIQAMYRRYHDRVNYLDYRRKKWAAGVIALSWIMHVKMAQVRVKLRKARVEQLDAFRRRSLEFAKRWSHIRTQRRVVIHIPSLGYSLHIREKMHDMAICQNTQMARLCDIRDPNVDVVYISPVPVNDEMLQYYSKLLGLKTAIDSGNVEDQADLSDRYRILTPEAINSFPSHHMCLATILKYSPVTMKRLKNLIRGREAYIVTQVPHNDDVYVSHYLDVPVMCPEPDTAFLYSSKSGSKRIFADAAVTTPPGEFDVYSLPQLHECLAQLITENLEVTRWLFKLDDEYNGRGIAYVDIGDHLHCYQWALKEAQRYGDKWKKKWAQEAAYIKIHAEVPELLSHHARPNNTDVYATWEVFLEAFISQGGVIEACPPSDSVTALTADMLIEPNGEVSIVSVGDQIHDDSLYTCWGLSVPQSSVEPETLNENLFKVAEACRVRGVVGYFAIDFVTFIHPKTMVQELWTVDLNLSYSGSAAMSQLLQFVSCGSLDVKTHFFDVPPPKMEEKKLRRRRLKEEEAPLNTKRYAVMSTKLFHTNLSVVHYSVFFQMCRAHGIGYDIKEKQGTVFTLIDSFSREHLGMLSVGDNLQSVLSIFASNLSVIHQEISAPNMQGNSNFRPVIEDIEGILGTTVENAEEQEKESEEGRGETGS